LIGLIGLILALTLTGFGLGNKGLDLLLHWILPRYKVETTQQLAGAVVRISSPRWPEEDFLDLVEVMVDGAVCFRATVEHPSSGEVRIAGPNAPLLWIRSTSSGSGGYSTTWLFRSGGMAGGVVPVGVLENGVFEGSTWVQPDVTYRYWLTSSAASPTPVLRARIDPEASGPAKPLVFLEADAPPSPSALAELKATVAATEPSVHAADPILGAALRGFLDLVYAGHAREAWMFFRECYDGGIGRLVESGFVADLPRSREAFESVLVERMRQSPYYNELLRRNGGSIGPPER